MVETQLNSNIHCLDIQNELQNCLQFFSKEIGFYLADRNFKRSLERILFQNFYSNRDLSEKRLLLNPGAQAFALLNETSAVPKVHHLLRIAYSNSFLGIRREKGVDEQAKCVRTLAYRVKMIPIPQNRLSPTKNDFCPHFLHSFVDESLPDANYPHSLFCLSNRDVLTVL